MSTARLMKRMLSRKQPKPTPPRAKDTLQMEYTRLCSQVGDALFKTEMFKKQIDQHFVEMSKISNEMGQVLEAEQKANEGATDVSSPS